MCTPGGNWYLCWATSSGGNDRIVMNKSTNGLTTFGSVVNKDLHGNGGGFDVQQQGSLDAVMDDSGIIHVAAGGLLAAGTYGVMYVEYDTSADTFGAKQDVFDTTVATNAYKPLFVFIGVGTDDKSHIIATFADSASFTTKVQLHYFTNASGSWSANAYPYGAARNGDNYGVITMNGTAPVVVLIATGIGTNTTKFNMEYYTKATGSWVGTTVTDTAEDHFEMTTLREYQWTHGHPLLGAIFTARIDKATDDKVSYTSSDLAFIQDYEKTVTQTILLESLVSLPDGTQTTISPTMSRIGLGGRQTTRIGSRIYTLAADTTNNRTHCFYSDNEGASWTQETIVNYAAEAAAISQGAGSLPVVCLVNSGSNEIRPYLRTSAGGWTHKSDVGTGNVGTCQAFQILYDGSLYHLLYSRINTTNTRRQVRHSTSAALTGWSHATIDNGDTNDIGPYDEKALAACMDQDDDIHLVYTQITGNTFVLRYLKRTGSTWGSAETLQELGADNLDSRRAIHLCIVTDKNAVPYVWGVEYTGGNFRIFTQNRVGGTWSTKENPISENVDQLFPSGGFEDRQFPTVVFAANLPDGTIHRMVKRNGIWIRDVLSGEAGAQKAEQVYDPRFNSAVTMQGTFCVFQESILVFVTSQIVWGDSAASSGDAVFSHTIRLAGRDRVNHSLVLTSVLSDPAHGYDRPVEHSLPLWQAVAAIKDLARTFVHAITMRQGVAYTYDPLVGFDVHFKDVAHILILEQQSLGNKTAVKGVTHSLVMSQVGPGLTYAADVEHDVEMDDQIELQAIRNVTVGADLSMSQVVFLNRAANVGVTHSLTMSHGPLRIRSWVWNSTHHNPGWAAEYEGDVTDFIITGPAEAPTIEMTMPRPDFGDEDTLSWRADSVRRNRTGQAKVFRAPIYEEYKFTWSGFLRKRAHEFRALIMALAGRNVRIRDHNGVWKNVVISGASVTSTQTGPEFVNVEVQFEEKNSVA
jgi:hypothetical protein